MYRYSCRYRCREREKDIDTDIDMAVSIHWGFGSLCRLDLVAVPASGLRQD